MRKPLEVSDFHSVGISGTIKATFIGGTSHLKKGKTYDVKLHPNLHRVTVPHLGSMEFPFDFFEISTLDSKRSVLHEPTVTDIKENKEESHTGKSIEEAIFDVTVSHINKSDEQFSSSEKENTCISDIQVYEALKVLQDKCTEVCHDCSKCPLRTKADNSNGFYCYLLNSGRTPIEWDIQEPGRYKAF